MEHDERQPKPSAGEPSSDSPEEPIQPDEQTGDEFETAPSGSVPESGPEPAADESEGQMPEPPAAEEPPPAAAEPPAATAAEPPAAEEAPAAAEPPAAEEPPAAGAPLNEPPVERSEPVLASPPAAEPPPPEAEAYVAPPIEEHAETTQAHSVPATAIGESTLCPRCGMENRPGIAFCRQCGQRLIAPGAAATVARPGVPEGTQQCPRCGTHNRAGVAFCQNCGANLRATATPAPGYLPPSDASAAGSTAAAAAASVATTRGGAALGPIVLLIGAVGIATAWLLPFPFGPGSLWERSFGAAGGYGVAFWSGYPAVNGELADQAYFGFAAPAPVLVALLVVLAISGFLRASPGGLQRIGLLIALVWSLGLIALFAIVEGAGGWNGDLVQLVKGLTPGGIIFALASLIVLIGTFTRFARS
jgi:hypothetical protein